MPIINFPLSIVVMKSCYEMTIYIQGRFSVETYITYRDGGRNLTVVDLKTLIFPPNNPIHRDG